MARGRWKSRSAKVQRGAAHRAKGLVVQQGIEGCWPSEPKDCLPSNYIWGKLNPSALQTPRFAATSQSSAGMARLSLLRGPTDAALCLHRCARIAPAAPRASTEWIERPFASFSSRPLLRPAFHPLALCILLDSRFSCSPQCTGEYVLARGSQADMRMSHLSPPARNGQKNMRRLFYERRLLLKCKLQVSEALCLRSLR